METVGAEMEHDKCQKITNLIGLNAMRCTSGCCLLGALRG